MMKLLADAELILGFFRENEYAKDAERLLKKAESQQIELYITQLCLDKVRSEDKFRAKPDAKGGGIACDLEKMFFGYVIPYDDCLIGEQVFQCIENTRNFECLVETACAIACGVGAVVTHKPEDFAARGLLVWSVDEIVFQVLLDSFVCQVLLTASKGNNFVHMLCRTELCVDRVGGENREPLADVTQFTTRKKKKIGDEYLYFIYYFFL